MTEVGRVTFLTILFAGLLSASNHSFAEASGDATSIAVIVREECGIPRRREPTRVSLPFPKGELQQQTDIVITDGSSSQIPAQFEVLARWSDGSIRWLLAHFLIDVPAHGSVTLTVRRDANGSNPSAPNLAEKHGHNFVVDTGPIRVHIGPDWYDGFRATDQTGHELLDETPRLLVYSPTGEEYLCGLPDEVELEANGPLYTSVFLAGRMEA